MSALLKDIVPAASNQQNESSKSVVVPSGNYKGFVAGAFSGIAKLTGSGAIRNL